jgi:hypothetical protein
MGHPEAKQMPACVFIRRRDIELEAGLILAGQLVVDLPKNAGSTRHHQEMVASIIQGLLTEVRSGQIPDDAVVTGWHGGCRPDNAVDVFDDALMAAWAETRLVVAVRVDPRSDGRIRVDSDMQRQMRKLAGH